MEVECSDQSLQSKQKFQCSQTGISSGIILECQYDWTLICKRNCTNGHTKNAYEHIYI